MVKIVQKGAQDPTDSSLQMKVPHLNNSDPPILSDGTQTTH